jgi:S-adenosylmethionine-dependent methyltransferase
VEFYKGNADNLPAEIKESQFDFVIFFASLEHMTYNERLKALSDSWAMLPSGRFLCCVGTPNRLWYVDGHTSHLPFYHWLPDQLAIRYAKFSSDLALRRTLGDFEPTSQNEEHLIRAGRGMSFHELELAIGPIQNLEIVSCLYKSRLYRVMREGPLPDADDNFIRSLMALAPGIHPAWFFPRLDLIIKKP